MKLSKQQFAKELNNCLKIIEKLETNSKDEYFKCEYINFALYKQTIIVQVY